MKLFDRARIFEATRLTRAGRLDEAMALLQGAFAGKENVAKDAPIPLRPQNISEGSPDPGPRVALPTALPRMSIDAPLHMPADWMANLPGSGRSVKPADIAPDAGSYVSGTFSDSGGSRSYKLYIPSAYKKPCPLIVMLHGCKQSADDFAAGTRMNFAAEARGCFVVYPEQPQAANASKCWNWFRPGDQTRDRGEPALIAGITRQVIAEYSIDPGRVYVAGLSAGGAAAAIMGEAYPDLFAAAGVHSGLACGSAHDLASAFGAMRGQAVGKRRQAAKAMPTIVFHGDRDATVHPCNGTKVIARALADAELQTTTERGSATSGATFSRYVQRDADGRSILELWELHGAGHAWSGGSSAGSFTDPNGPDATGEVLRFFLEQPRYLKDEDLKANCR
jgi:poly(hydroxyalkanoate) depolymerase family esterase